MKNLKNVLSALAFVFAIGAAFAFTLPKEESFAIVDGYYHDGNQCTTPKECSTTGGTPCTFTPIGGEEITLRPLSMSSCSTGTLFEKP